MLPPSASFKLRRKTVERSRFQLNRLLYKITHSQAPTKLSIRLICNLGIVKPSGRVHSWSVSFRLLYESNRMICTYDIIPLATHFACAIWVALHLHFTLVPPIWSTMTASATHPQTHWLSVGEREKSLLWMKKIHKRYQPNNVGYDMDMVRATQQWQWQFGIGKRKNSRMQFRQNGNKMWWVAWFACELCYYKLVEAPHFSAYVLTLHDSQYHVYRSLDV